MRSIRRIVYLTLLVMVGATACSPQAVPTSLPAASPSPAKPPTPQVLASPTVTPLPTLTPVPAPYAGGLFVDASQVLGPISPLVYGSNYGPWLFITMEMMPQAIAAKISILRYPGGEWGDQNDLDEWQIDQYLALCKQLGSQPSISVRLKGGTAEKAAALVKLVNRQKKAGVKYWSIGNEPSLYPDYEIDTFNQQWRQIALAMEEVDPSILLVGPEIHQFTADPSTYPKDSTGRDWLAEFLKANGDMVDVVSIHRYPFPRTVHDSPPTKADLRKNSQEWDQIIPALRAIIRKNTGRDLPIAVTEVNSSYARNTGGEATLDSLYNAIWWGDVLGRMIRQGVDIVAQFAIVDDFGLMGKYKVYPIYYDYLLYGKFGQERLYASSDQPDVSVYAARRADGALTLMLINLAPEAKSVPIQIDGLTNETSGAAWRLDASHNAEALDFSIVDGKVELPGESITLYVLSKG
jgi:hypothetical protein